MQGDVVHIEVAMIVWSPHPGQIMVGGATRRDDRVDELSFDQTAKDPARF